MVELEHEGGVEARFLRYSNNQKTLVEGMKNLGFAALLQKELQSPIITSFYYPAKGGFVFEDFYNYLKRRGYVIYPGKTSKAATFRIGNIGDVHQENIEGLLQVIKEFLDR
jgi:2-aminoethylphosphonate-pyruvate transaminase